MSNINKIPINCPKIQAEYGDASTLPAKINRHCLLLATRKTTTSKAPAPGSAAAGGVCSFVATPISTGAPVYRSAHVKVLANVPLDGSGSRLGHSSSSICMPGPSSDSTRPSQPAPRDPAAGEPAAPHAPGSAWLGAGHKLNVGGGAGPGGGGWGSVGGHHDAGGGGHGSVSGGGSDGELFVTTYYCLSQGCLLNR